MGVLSIQNSQNSYYHTIAKKIEEKVASGDFSKLGAMPEKGEGAPYSYLANAEGVIEYEGVVFTLDHEKKRICLGDVSDMNQVIRIPLSEGGSLLVNRNCVDQLSKAIGMFSPKDINLILRALKLDAKLQQMKKEIEDMEDGVSKTSEEEYADSTESAEEAIAEKEEVLLAAMMNGDGETVIPLGGSEFTQSQWDKLLGNVDEAIDDMKERTEAEKERLEEEQKKEEIKKEKEKEKILNYGE